MSKILITLTIVVFCCTASGLASSNWIEDLNTSELCKNIMGPDGDEWIPGFWLWNDNFPENGFTSLGHCISWAQKYTFDALGNNPREGQEWCDSGLPIVYICKWAVSLGVYDKLGPCIKDGGPPCDW